jgi:inosose dehydratase
MHPARGAYWNLNWKAKQPDTFKCWMKWLIPVMPVQNLGDWGFMPTDPAQLAHEIHSRGLTMLGAFIPVKLKDPNCHAAGIETAIRIASLLAAVEGDVPFIVLADENGSEAVRTQNAGRVTPEMGLSDAQWAVFADGANKLAAAVKKKPDCAPFSTTTVPDTWRRQLRLINCLSLTDPALLGLVFDTGHYRFGGGDPLEGLRKHADRVWHFHFKDYHPELGKRSAEEGWDYFQSVRSGIFCELGKGEIDFAAIVAELERMGYEGWGVVEQDVLPGMGSPKESAQRNREFLKSIGL